MGISGDKKIMANFSGAILWDFEGTLAVHPGLWSYSLLEVLNKHEPGHRVDIEQIRPFLRTGFPWHRPEEPHLHLLKPDAWWLNLELVFARAYQGVGFDANRALELAKHVRQLIIDPRRYAVYDDAIPALESLKIRGWKCSILSNHVPELPAIVQALGLSSYIDFCMSSANSGYEKPNPKAFRYALRIIDNPEKVWMIGDNVDADIKGAEAVGIPAILVRNPPHENVKYYAHNLSEAIAVIEGKNPSDL